MKRDKEIEVIGESCDIKVTLGIGDRIYLERRMENPDKSISWIPWMEFTPSGKHQMEVSILTLEVRKK